MSASRPKRLLPRFSLRTLVVFLLLVTSAMGVSLRLNPWRRAYTLDGVQVIGGYGGDCIVTTDSPYTGRRLKWDAKTGEARGELRSDEVLRGCPGSWPGGRQVAKREGCIYVQSPRAAREYPLSDVPESAYTGIYGSQGDPVVCVSIQPSKGEVIPTRRRVEAWRLRRPEWWWGVFYLWEFWVTAIFAALLVWSVVKDRGRLSGQEVS